MALATWMQLDDTQRIEEKSVLVEGHRMSSLVTGSGADTVLLHGLLGSAEAWFPCLQRLGRESKVYAVDALGIGNSERVPGLDASLTAQADRVARFMQHAGIARADLVGTSHGGTVAMMLAARHPHRVRSLVLHAPANPFSALADPVVHFYRSPLGRWFAYQVPHLPERVQEMALTQMYGNARLIRHRVIDRYTRSLRVPGTIDHVLNMLNRWFEDMRALQAALQGLPDIPILLLWGTRDRAVSLESGRALQAVLHQAEMIVLPGVGHLPYEEAPAAFSEAVNGFLRKVGRTHEGLRLVRPMA